MTIGRLGTLIISVVFSVLCRRAMVLRRSCVRLALPWLGLGTWVKCENLLMTWCRLLARWTTILAHRVSVLWLLLAAVSPLNPCWTCLVDSRTGASGPPTLRVMWWVMLF